MVRFHGQSLFLQTDFGVCKSPIGKEYGYGLAQWTYTTRKAALYDYAKSRGVSIGDLNMQLDFMMREMSASLKSYLRTATDVSDACVRFHNIYEGSADTESMIAGRVAKAKNVYNKYASIHNGNNLSTVAISDGLYVLESKLDSTKAIDVFASSMESDANIELWTKNGENNQKFKIEKDGSTYKITAYHSGLSMDVHEASSASGTNIKQCLFWGENNLAQKWQFQDAGDGYVYIRSMLGTYVDACVYISNGVVSDGGNIWAYSFNGSDAQKWKLVPTSCAHTYESWSVTKAASCTESGTEKRTCTLCKNTDTRTISELGHNYVNGVCSRCGERDPNAQKPTTPVNPEPNKNEVHFPKMTVYFQGQFSDVPADQWFTNNVANAFSFGLMKGNSATTFDPYGDVTVAEAIAMAARIHSIYTTGTENFTQGTPWYQCYLDYAYKNKIISYAYYNCDVKHKATRAQFAEIFAAALPDEALSIKNSVSDNAVPDVKMKDSYSAPVYKLYRAGILAGGDAKGTFSPGTFITRAECATIVARMADSDNRVSFSLT